MSDRPFLAQVHQDHVDRQAVQPRRKGGVAAKCGDLAVQLKEGLLGQILGLGDIAHHAQAQRIDTPFMQRVELRKSVVIAGLGSRQGIGIAGKSAAAGALQRPESCTAAVLAWLRQLATASLQAVA